MEDLKRVVSFTLLAAVQSVTVNSSCCCGCCVNSLSVKTAATTRTSSLYSHYRFLVKLQSLINAGSILSDLAKTEGINETTIRGKSG